VTPTGAAADAEEEEEKEAEEEAGNRYDGLKGNLFFWTKSTFSGVCIHTFNDLFFGVGESSLSNG